MTEKECKRYAHTYKSDQKLTKLPNWPENSQLQTQTQPHSMY